MNRTIFYLILLSTMNIATVNAQKNHYIHLSFDAGGVVNTSQDKLFGMGGTIGWLTKDNIMTFNPNNYLSLSIKAFNNPYNGGKFISSIMNNANDAFNYIVPLVGCRFTQDGIENGFFIEPRVGVAIGSDYTGFVLSPSAGYAVKQFNLSAYCDMGFGSKQNAILKKSFFTPGISIGYNIGIH